MDFRLWYSEWCGGQGAAVALNGTGNESNGPSYSFGLYDAHAAPFPLSPLNWTSPNGKLEVLWNGESVVHWIVWG